MGVVEGEMLGVDVFEMMEGKKIVGSGEDGGLLEVDFGYGVFGEVVI